MRRKQQRALSRLFQEQIERRRIRLNHGQQWQQQSSDNRGDLSLMSAFRSRSDAEGSDNGDGDADSLGGQPRAHACSPSFVSSLYPRRWPAAGELVICLALDALPRQLVGPQSGA